MIIIDTLEGRKEIVKCSALGQILEYVCNPVYIILCSAKNKTDAYLIRN